MNDAPPDAELLARSVDDPELFGSIYERHGVPVRHYVARRVGSDAGDDLSAEVFVRAFRGRGRYRPELDSALPWLLGVANNVIADHRRLEKRRLATLGRLVEREPLLVDHAGAELSGELLGALRRLPAAERDTLLLVVWGELSLAEAASALAVPVGTVSSRISRARKQLALALTGRDPVRASGLRTTGDLNV